MSTVTDPTHPPAAPEVRELPVQSRELQLVPDSFNEADNTVEVVWTTGARVRRYDPWADTPYEEELAVTPDAVDMSRFDAGAVNVLNGHRSWGGVESIMGVVTRAWLEGGIGRATLRLSQRADLAPLVADIKAGIIRNVSVGYSVQRYAITRAVDRTDGGTVPLYTAARWQPAEISFVSVPADAMAGTRGADAAHHRSQGGMPCEFIRAAAQTSPLESTMSKPDDTPKGGTASPETETQRHDVAAERAAADKTAVERSASILDLCTRSRVPELAADLIRSGKSLEQAGLAIAEKLAARDQAAGGHRNGSSIQTVSDETETRMRGMEEAVMHRVDAGAKLTDNGRRFRGMSLLELGREHLEANNVSTRGMDRMALATRMLHHRSGDGMHTVSDFSSLMANVASKRLRQAYEENTGSYRAWARRAPNAPDFKSMSVVQLGAAPELLQTNEAGEFKYGTLRDGAESYSLITFGRIVSLSRQSIVNDDLRAFDRLSLGFGASAARLENRLVYAQLTSNPTMSDTGALFNATAITTAGGHANLATGAGSALQFSSLTSMRGAMRVQKGLQGEELSLVPSYLIVPAALEQTAYQLTSSQYVPAQQSNVNEFRAGGRTALEPIVEPILDADSATRWYGVARNSQVDTVEYCYLDGAEGVVIESETGFEVDGVSFKARLDFATKVIDWRGLYRANGA